MRWLAGRLPRWAAQSTAVALLLALPLSAQDKSKISDAGKDRAKEDASVVERPGAERPVEDIHAPRPRTGPNNPAAPPKTGEPINDKAVYRFLEIEGEKMVKAGHTLTSWKAQLDRKSCALKLPAAGRRSLTVAEIARRAESSVAIIGTFYLCGKCSNLHMGTASGFFLNESGALATSRHVLASYNDNGEGVVVLTRDGRLCPVREVLAADTVNDLVVLQVEGKGFTPLPLSTEAALGSPITLVSHPENHFYTLTTGVVSRRSTSRGRRGVVEALSITADFAKGSSGAPVCNDLGAVIGLVNNTQSIYYETDRGRQENLQMVVKNCTPASALLALIQQK